MNSSRSTRLKKDAIIALAILIVLLLFWRVLSRPEHLGGFGRWAQSGLFGASGVRLAESLGSNTNGTPTTIPSPPGTSEDNSNSVPPPIPPRPLAGTAGAAGDPIQTNSPDKVIAGFDTNDVTPPLTSSAEAAAIAKRLSDAGAKGGDIEFSLFWRNFNDLDLHCIDPKGFEIYFSNLKSPLTGGELDIDCNAALPFTNAPIENIYWPAGAPPGIYQVGVVYYAKHDTVDATRYTVRTVVKDKTNYFTGVLNYAGPQRSRWICRIQYDPQNTDPVNRCRFLPVR